MNVKGDHIKKSQEQWSQNIPRDYDLRSSGKTGPAMAESEICKVQKGRNLIGRQVREPAGAYKK